MFEVLIFSTVLNVRVSLRENYLFELIIIFLSVPIHLSNTYMAYHYRLLTFLGVISLFVLSVTSQGKRLYVKPGISRSFLIL